MTEPKKLQAVDDEPPDAAKSAAQAEAEGDETLDVEWQGYTFTIPAQIDEWSGDALEAFEGGKAITAVRELVGSSRLDAVKREYRKQHGRAMRVKDYGEIVDAVAKRYGLTPPE